MVSFREQKKERTRKRLAAASIDLLNQGGPEAATIQAIAQQAEVSPRTFHNYFDSRDHALIYAVKEVSRTIATGFAEAPAEATPLEITAYAIERMVFENTDDLSDPYRVLGLVNWLPMVGVDSLKELREALDGELLGELTRVCQERHGIDLSPVHAGILLDTVFLVGRNAIEAIAGECVALFHPAVARKPLNFELDAEELRANFREGLAFVTNGFSVEQLAQQSN